MTARWIRFPTLHHDTVVFTCEDDLWSASVGGGLARRITTGLGHCGHPRLSPDGSSVAFTGTEEGLREVYVVDPDGGQLRRLTWGRDARVVGWTPESEIVFTSAAGRPFARDSHLHVVDPGGGLPRRLPWGPAEAVAFAPGDEPAVAICRHQHDLAWWKGYRGGRAGAIWVRPEAAAPWQRLPLPGNVVCPQWVAGRLAFVSDHEGDAQLYSCDATGSDVQRHSDHEGLAVRYLDAHGDRLVYTHGGDLWLWEPGEAPRRLDIEVRSQRARMQRRYPRTAAYVEDIDPHPEGHSLCAIVRGRPFVLGNWSGPVRQLGARDGVRYGLGRWIDEQRLLAVSDDGGEEHFEVVSADGAEVTPLRAEGLGAPVEVEIDPTATWAAVTNHRQELHLVRLDGSTQPSQLVVGVYGTPHGLTWSSDGRWLAWAHPEASWGQRSSIRMVEISAEAGAGEVIRVTNGLYRDVSPSFDPSGDHLYMISAREFDPVMDAQYFGYGFFRGTRPYAITLRRDVPHPFRPEPAPLRSGRSTPEADATKVEIDLDGLSDRIVPFPVSEGRYDRIIGMGKGRVWMIRSPVRGTLDRSWRDTGPPKADKQLLSWDFDKQELSLLNGRVTSLRMDRSRKHAVLRSGFRVRVIPTTADRSMKEELKKTEGKAGRKHMWVDLSRIRLSVDPAAEWRQMVDQAWRLMREHYWLPSMGGVDWDDIRTRYAELVERVSTRRELSDLIWSMQGELRTSHAYELGGDHRPTPLHRIGDLGADLEWDEATPGWRIARVVRGEPGDPRRASPLLAPGVDVSEGDVIQSISGVEVRPDEPPEVHLVNRAGDLVELSLLDEAGQSKTTVVRSLRSGRDLRYRSWVFEQRARVHEASQGRIGYVHVPDMGPGGFAEFHRDFMQEASRDALLVDVRFNRGGHVSQLLLDRLARRRLGYSVPRWGKPNPYPAYSVVGPMACLTNEMAGSDGDIFSHAWKLMELGPLIGTRTWGGVVGISPRNKLVDRSITTQPEYSTWFEDVGYGLENYGTTPDVVVDFPPDAWESGEDPQLSRGISMLLDALHDAPPTRPNLEPAVSSEEA
ncbi:MAG: PDZ domain-containing protein [Myxococcales bacterium]|nr:PDZ domain-containing protein [Myxococcales bacterium]